MWFLLVKELFFTVLYSSCYYWHFSRTMGGFFFLNPLVGVIVCRLLDHGHFDQWYLTVLSCQSANNHISHVSWYFILFKNHELYFPVEVVFFKLCPLLHYFHLLSPGNFGGPVPVYTAHQCFWILFSWAIFFRLLLWEVATRRQHLLIPSSGGGALEQVLLWGWKFQSIVPEAAASSLYCYLFCVLK